MVLTTYSDLKDQIAYNIAASNRHSEIIYLLKEHFKYVINSPRRYEKINTVSELLKVLEIRDVISEDNVEKLKDVARLINNSNDLIRMITDYELNHTQREYQSYYGSNKEKDTNCDQSEFNQLKDGLTPVITYRKKEVYDVIIKHIGTFWRDLARYLKIKENTIDHIDRNFDTLHVKATKLLEIFDEQMNQMRCVNNQAYIDILCKSLERSRRKDLVRRIKRIVENPHIEQ